MATLFRNSRSIITRFTYIRRTATTTVATHSTKEPVLPVQLARQRFAPSDAIKSRPAGETPFIPLVGTALNTTGRIALTIFLGISAYFVYINYITNPEFYKSLNLSREAHKRDKLQKIAEREGASGHKSEDAHESKGGHNKH